MKHFAICGAFVVASLSALSCSFARGVPEIETVRAVDAVESNGQSVQDAAKTASLVISFSSFAVSVILGVFTMLGVVLGVVYKHKIEGLVVSAETNLREVEAILESAKSEIRGWESKINGDLMSKIEEIASQSSIVYEREVKREVMRDSAADVEVVIPAITWLGERGEVCDVTLIVNAMERHSNDVELVDFAKTAIASLTQSRSIDRMSKDVEEANRRREIISRTDD